MKYLLYRAFSRGLSKIIRDTLALKTRIAELTKHNGRDVHFVAFKSA